jgi:hypothetical protein
MEKEDGGYEGRQRKGIGRRKREEKTEKWEIELVGFCPYVSTHARWPSSIE